MNEQTSEISLKKITTFFDCLKELVYLPEQRKEKELILKTQAMFFDYKALMEENRKVNLLEAPEFNIFTLTRVIGSELFHSRFLANLLNPTGTHGQGSLFIDTFLQHFLDDWYELTHSKLNSEEWRVHTEKVTSNGNFDIFAMNRYSGMLFIIENKIYASEQENQLRRYHNWMKTETQLMDFPRQHLYFLTPSGYLSGTLEEDRYTVLSYRIDIATWLSNSIELIQATGLREVIKQYISAIALI
jgi:hypothetical protein